MRAQGVYTGQKFSNKRKTFSLIVWLFSQDGRSTLFSSQDALRKTPMNAYRFEALRFFDGTAVSNNLHIFIIILKEYKTWFLAEIPGIRQKFGVSVLVMPPSEPFERFSGKWHVACSPGKGVHRSVSGEGRKKDTPPTGDGVPFSNDIMGGDVKTEICFG